MSSRPLIYTQEQNNIVPRVPVVPNIPSASTRNQNNNAPLIPVTNVDRRNALVYSTNARNANRQPVNNNVGVEHRFSQIVQNQQNIRSEPVPPVNINSINNLYNEVPSVPIIKPMFNKKPRFEDKKSVNEAINPYLLIPDGVLNSIVQERDITLFGTIIQKAKQLSDYDDIMPDWIESILTSTIDNCQLLNINKLYIFGALNCVYLKNIERLSHIDLFSYIRVSIILNTPNHPKQNILATLINNLNRKLLEIFIVQYKIHPNYIKFISDDDMRMIILTKNPNIINNSIEVLAKRYKLLTTHIYSNLLDQLYNIEGKDEKWIDVTRKAPHPLETIILELDSFKIEQIIQTFGMVVPLAYANNPKRYIQNNIVNYAPILTRGNLNPIAFDLFQNMSVQGIEVYLDKLTDKEIFANIGIYIPYDSRVELIRNTARTFTRPRFMYPTIRNEARCFNKTTVTLETNISDINTFMICYGTASKYYIYEICDFIGAFYRDSETGTLAFRHPENINYRFSINDIEELKRLLSCFSPTNEILNLINCIDDGLINAKEKIGHDSIALGELKTFDKTTCDLIRQFLRQIFYTGMYMRRWQGPGYPYPLEAKTTEIKIDPDTKVTEQLGIGVEILKQMGPIAKKFCFNLKICEYDQQGNIDHSLRTFNREWNAVIEGSQCIRMASSKFVGTGYHYLRSLFKEIIPNVNVKTVDRIT